MASRFPRLCRDSPLGCPSIEELKAFKAERGQDTVNRQLAELARVAKAPKENSFAAVVAAAEAGLTHGEIIACLRHELGFGHPLIVA